MWTFEEKPNMILRDYFAAQANSRSDARGASEGRRRGMKKYVTFAEDEEQSRKVREALFSAGFEWMSGDTHFRHPDARFLFIEDGQILQVSGRAFVSGGAFVSAFRIAKIEGHIPVNAEDIIADPFQLDGAKRPTPKVQLDAEHTAEVHESYVKVGCSTFSHEKILELAEAIRKARGRRGEG